MTFNQSCFKKQAWLFAVVFFISPWCSMMPLHLQRPWHNYFLQPGQVAQTSAQSIFLRCLCRNVIDVCKSLQVCAYLGTLGDLTINQSILYVVSNILGAKILNIFSFALACKRTQDLLRFIFSHFTAELQAR